MNKKTLKFFQLKLKSCIFAVLRCIRDAARHNWKAFGYSALVNLDNSPCGRNMKDALLSAYTWVSLFQGIASHVFAWGVSYFSYSSYGQSRAY